MRVLCHEDGCTVSFVAEQYIDAAAIDVRFVLFLSTHYIYARIQVSTHSML